MRVACVFADENDGECKEEREDDADGIIVFDETRLAEQFDKRDGNDAHQRRTKEQPRGAEIMREKEGKHDAEQNSVTDRVRHHREAAQDEKDTERRTCCCRQEEYEECVIH